MNESIFPVFLVVFREALEAGLIIGIILTAVARIGQKHLIPAILGSVVAAVGVSVLAGFGIMSLADSAQGDWGKIIDECSCEIPNHFPNIQLDNYVIMPNHVHGIITIVGAASPVLIK